MKLEHQPEPASVPARVSQFAGGAAFNAARQFVRAGGGASLRTPSSPEPFVPFANGVELAKVGRGGTLASYTAILAPDGELVVAASDMRLYDDLAAQPGLSSACGPFVLIDANLSRPFLEQFVSELDPETQLYAMAVSPAKIVRLRSFVERIDVLFANQREMEALGSDAPRASLVTQGSDGLIYDDGESRTLHTVDRQLPVDVTGAGDAVTGAFLFARTNGSGAAEALEHAAAAAADTIMGEGPFPFLENA